VTSTTHKTWEVYVAAAAFIMASHSVVNTRPRQRFTMLRPPPKKHLSLVEHVQLSYVQPTLTTRQSPRLQNCTITIVTEGLLPPTQLLTLERLRFTNGLPSTSTPAIPGFNKHHRRGLATRTSVIPCPTRSPRNVDHSRSPDQSGIPNPSRPGVPNHPWRPNKTYALSSDHSRPNVYFATVPSRNGQRTKTGAAFCSNAAVYPPTTNAGKSVVTSLQCSTKSLCHTWFAFSVEPWASLIGS
jgi:hypothetical protein